MRFPSFLSLIVIILISSIFITSSFAKRAAIIIDYDTQEVLFEVNADTLNYPASLVKMMTLYILFDYLDKNKIQMKTKMKVSEVAASRSPTKLYLEEGSTISVEDAIEQNFKEDFFDKVNADILLQKLKDLIFR